MPDTSKLALQDVYETNPGVRAARDRLDVRAARDRLAVYRTKRDTSRTPEPVPATHGSGTGEDLTFVIQEHHARRLHWDLRLSHEGVLVSWALPKGVPVEGKKNHLAVQTEDHPMEYATFHGTIPKGEYGAGEMMIWDWGTYQIQKWREGKEVIVTLTGAPDGGLGGPGGPGRTSRFALIRTGGPGREDNHWLIHLMDPERAEAGTSPAAGRTTAGRVSAAKAPPRAQSERTPSNGTPSSPGQGAVPPRPMLATAGNAAGLDTDHDWAFEMKWDGVRTIAVVDGDRVRLLGRSGKDTTAQYPEGAALAAYVDAEHAVLDGEIVAMDAQGRPSFSLLQLRMQSTNSRDIANAARRRPVRLILFDVLEVDDSSLLDLSYDDRRTALEDLLDVPADALVQVPPAFEGDLEHAMAASRSWGLEGVMAKRRDARYLPGRRSRAWVKIKHSRTQEVVVAGWRPGKGEREARVGSLLLGVPDDGGLRYVGRVGTGFSEQETKDWVGRFAAVGRKTSPVEDVPASDARDARWITPTWVAEVEFGEWTPGGRLRHPRWRGWRPDKAPGQVHLE